MGWLDPLQQRTVPVALRLTVLTLVTLFLFLLLAAIGDSQADREVRVLGVFTPLVEWIQDSGTVAITWAVVQREFVGQTISLEMAVIAALGLLAGRRRSLPILLLAVSVSLAVWGQVRLLDEDRIVEGAWFYAAGIAASFALGNWCPMQRLRGFPRMRSLARDDAAPDVTEDLPALGWRELGFVLGVTVIGLVFRVWNLMELPHRFDLESVHFMMASRTGAGILGYMQFGMISNNNGMFHILTMNALYHLFGTSLFAIRMTAVFWGMLGIPLIYFLVRRMGGILPAVLAAILFACAPDQLFWSRTENNFFSGVAFVSLATALLAMRMVEQWRFGSVLLVALWMPFCRYFYTPAMVLVLLPLAMQVHSLLFVRGSFRKAVFSVPTLLLGLALWTTSLSFVQAAVNDWRWRFVHPAVAHAGPVWRKHGEAKFRDATPAQLVKLQLESMSTNLQAVVSSVVYHGDGMFSHWYERGELFLERRTILIIGLAVILALGLGYLVGQIQDRRAFLLLVWIALGLLPGIMSNEPSPRRTSVMFPAFYAVSALFLAAAIRIVRDRSADWVASVAAVPFLGGGASVAAAGLAAHLLLSMAPVQFEDHVRRTAPIFESSDVILHNLHLSGMARALVLGNSDVFLARKPCYEKVEAIEWPRLAFNPDCTYRDDIYPNLMSESAIEAMRATSEPPRRITFLFEQDDYSRRFLDQLAKLYPTAETRRYTSPRDLTTLIALTLDAGTMAKMRRPSIRVGRGVSVPVEVIAGVATDRVEYEGAGLVVSGGVQFSYDGWYRLQTKPPCPSAKISVDGIDLSSQQPLLAGVHTFELVLPEPASCRLPLEVAVTFRAATAQSTDSILAANAFLSPAAAAFVPFQARRVVAFAGYDRPAQPLKVGAAAMDIGWDTRGRMYALTGDYPARVLHRFDEDGKENLAWSFELHDMGHLPALIVNEDGSTIVAAGTKVLRFGPNGEPLPDWKLPWLEWLSDLTRWREGEIAVTVPDRNSITFFADTGKARREWKEFSGGPQKFRRPICTARGPDGKLLVVEDDGHALLFEGAGEEADPKFVREFDVPLSVVPSWTHHCGFDGPDRVVIADWTSGLPIVHDLRGDRLMAGDPARDFQSMGVGRVTDITKRDGRLLMLEQVSGRLLSFPTN